MCDSYTTVPDDLKESVNLWLTYDKNPETRSELLNLVEGKHWEELHRRLDERISFGTAGLRSRMEAGFSRMNTLTVLQASQGLASYIKSQFPENLSVVVGHDHRYHSNEFARVTVTAFLQLGFKVHYLNLPSKDSTETFVHTPMVPFTINQLNDSAGIMITASHNPKMDNGYKVYYSNGCQIIPPHDRLISETINQNLVPWDKAWDCDEVIKTAIENGFLFDVKEKMTSKYIKTVSDELVSVPMLDCDKPWFVYTPMHGVGFEIFKQIALLALGLKEGKHYICVPEQRCPDPAFPTVSFPNPEEKGALDLSIALAEEQGIRLVIANDPDADRFSVAVKNGDGWSQLTGNEIGFLFAYYQWQDYQKLGESFKKQHPLAMINSTVSSQMIKSLAEVEKFHYEDTLTGFKWLGNRAFELETQGYYVPFAYEEAIGYMFPEVEHDKDGISAAVVFLQMYCEWLSKDRMTPLQVLDEGFDKYGVFKEYNGYYIVPRLSLTKEVFDYIREDYTPSGHAYPPAIGSEFSVISFRDLTTGYQSDTIDNVPNLPVDASSQMITATLRPSNGKESTSGEQVRFTIRGSGTEPKLKVYIEAKSTDEKRAQHLARETWQVLRREWFRPERTGLETKF